jgi:hypothetical protein
MLRIGIGLDRSHRGKVTGLEVAVVGPKKNNGKKRRLSLTPVAEPGADLSLELYSAELRSDLLSDALDMPVEFVSPD